MLLVCALIFLIPIEVCYCENNADKIKFLSSYFDDKQYTLKFMINWNKDATKDLLFALKRKQISFNDNFTTTINAHHYHIIDLDDCQKCWEALDHLEQRRFFMQPNKIFAFVADYNASIFRKRIANYSLLVNCELTLIETSSEHFKLSQMYKIAPNSNFIWENVGTWNARNGIVFHTKQGIQARRKNFRGAHFRIALVLSDVKTLKHFNDFRYPWTDIFIKQNYGAMTRLLEYCNISYNFVRLYNYDHLRDKNYHSSFLFTGSAPYLTKDLIDIIDFIKVTEHPKISFFLKRPPKSYTTAIFSIAFNRHVWTASFVTLTLLSLALFVMLNMEGRREAIKEQEKFSAFDLALIALEAICQQGTATDPRSYSARTLELIMFMSYMFLYVSYSANILVLLQSTSTIKDFNEIKEYEINYAGMNTSGMQQYHSGIGTQLFGDNVNATNLLTIHDGMGRVKSGLFAFLIETQYGHSFMKENMTDYEVCGMQEIQQYVEFNLGFIALPKNSPYKEIFRVALLRIDELGFIKRHFLKYFLKPLCYTQGSSFDQVGIKETYEAMLLVVIGIVGGLVILIVEYSINQLKPKYLCYKNF